MEVTPLILRGAAALLLLVAGAMPLAAQPGPASHGGENDTAAPQPMYYCHLPEYSVGQTSAQYTEAAVCAANLAAYLPTQTTGVCYATAAAASAACAAPPPSVAVEPVFPRRDVASRTYDVAVVGAGASGIAAAIQAARLGSTVAALEETDWVGGQLATVSTMDEANPDIRGAGIYGEFIARVRSHYLDIGRSMGTCYWSASTACFEPLIGQRILKRMVDEVNAAGPGTVDIYLRAPLAGVIMVGDAVRGVRVANGAEIRAPVTIDATEYGDLLPLAGAAYRVGNVRTGAVTYGACVQAITYPAVIKEYPAGVPATLKIAVTPPGYEAARWEFERIVTRNGAASGADFPVNFAFHNGYRALPNSSTSGADVARVTKTAVNWANDYHDAPGPSYGLRAGFIEDRTMRRHIACQAKLKTIQFIYYVQTELDSRWSVADDEGFDTAYNHEENSCPEIPQALKEIEWRMPHRPYVRESRRGIGASSLTAKHIRRPGDPAPAPRLAPSTVAVGDYGIDLHGCFDDSTLESDLGETAGDATPGRGFFPIPYETLLPVSVDGLILAEKNISQSRLANGATRLQPSTMNIGQAAGTAAALATQQGLEPRHLPALAIQKALTASGSFVSQYQYDDVPTSHPFWADVQLTSAHGIMLGYGDGRFGITHALTRAQTSVAMTRVFGLELNSDAAVTFADVPASHPMLPYIDALARSGMTHGCSTTPRLFCPDALVSRGQLAAFTARGLGYDASGFVPTVQTYVDVSPAHLFYPFIEYLVSRGIRIPCAAATGAFCPGQPVDRGDASRFIGHTLMVQSGVSPASRPAP